MVTSFKQTVQKRYDARVKATAPIPEVDAYIFCTSSKYLGERLFPFQSLIIKILYGLWEKYPIMPEEQEVIDILKDEWCIDLDLDNRDTSQYVEILILVFGRRSGKSSLISFVETYEAYRLICKGDPQRYYQIRDRHTIYIINCAKDGDQAKDPFMLCKDNIRRIPFFSKYIDWTKDNESELRLFTPADLYENAKIRKYNDSRAMGTPKKNYLEGSIMIVAFTTSAASKRGKAIACLIFDEYAHFDRAKTTGGGQTEEDIVNEMPQTDYAMLKALSPSVKDFTVVDNGIRDGKIIMISSPKEKGGELYKHYCLAGGKEQANPNREDINPNFLMLQLSSWQCNPKYPFSAFDSDFKKDPIGSNMEYGSHFGEPSTSFIDSEKIDQMVDLDVAMSYHGNWDHQYIISVDPAAKGDTYVVSWGFVESNFFRVQGLTAFRPKIITNELTGKIIKAPVSSINEVVPFIKVLAGLLTQRGTLLEIVYDQWSSADSIMQLQQAGYVAVETFFTNKYKNVMYTNFLEKLNMGLVKVYGQAPPNIPGGCPVYLPGWLEQAKLELKYLEKIISGNTTYYGAPTSGPIQTDDFADSIANLVHRLILYQSGDPRIYKELFKQTGRPLTRNRRVVGRTAGGLFKGASSTAANTLNRVQDRL